MATEATNPPLLSSCVARAMSKHDDTHIYRLPFATDACFVVSQGYGGWQSQREAYYSIDFRMPVGTPVCASRRGVVSHVVDCYEEGGTDPAFFSKWNVVEIVHSDMSIAVYGHLAHRGVRVSRGMTVDAGDVIAASGNTGWSSFPHLHFHLVSGETRQRIPVRFATSRSNGEILAGRRAYSHPGTSLSPEWRPALFIRRFIARLSTALGMRSK